MVDKEEIKERVELYRAKAKLPIVHELLDVINELLEENESLEIQIFNDNLRNKS